MPELPLYDHDDLGTCFRAIRGLLIPEVQPATYIKRPFIGDGLQMHVRLERDWLDASWMFYIGVQSSLSFSEVQALLDKRSPAYIDFKMGASEEVDIRYRDAREGVSFTPEPDPPKIFPHANWSYFRVDRQSQPWEKVEETLNLAIRFNERLVVGKIDREEKLTLHHPTSGKTIGVSFAIFAMPTKG
jgi:type VI secretion system protein ImpJ